MAIIASVFLGGKRESCSRFPPHLSNAAAFFVEIFSY